MSFLLYRTVLGPVVSSEQGLFPLEADWDALLADDGLFETLEQCTRNAEPDRKRVHEAESAILAPLSPVTRQEVWAAGVTYRRSREARREESRASGGGSFYDRVYDADRPELFLKATPSRVVAPGQAMRLRRDSGWIVPEPEFTLLIAPSGGITGYTIGNDLSCRDIEGENPLYLPQAKTFDACAALGPAIRVTSTPLPPETGIALRIRREGETVFEGETTLAQMKRRFEDLVAYLFRELSHPEGVFLMTGTGIVPPDEISLAKGDEVVISVQGIGELRNPVD